MKAAALIAAGLLIAPAAAHARELADIRASGTLRICVAGSNAKFYQANAGAFAAFLRVKPEVRQLRDWDEQFRNAQGVTVADGRYEAQLLADGSCDVFPNDLHVLPWRQSKMTLVPYYAVRKVIVSRSELRGVLRDVNDLGGRKAAVQKGTAYDTWLSEQNAKALAQNPVTITHAPTAEGVKLVADARADFTVLGSEGAFRWVRSDLGQLDILFAVDETVEVGWAIGVSAPALRRELERFFEQSKRVNSALDRQWLQEHGISLMEYQLFSEAFARSGIEFATLVRWAAPLGIALLLVLGAMGYWNRRLNREIVRRRQTEAVLVEERANLARAKDAAEEASRAKSAFLANVSHELRTPMNAIIGMAHLVLESELTTRQRGYVQQIHDSGARLKRIVNGILDFSDVEGGALRLSAADFALRDMLERVAAAAREQVAHTARPITVEMGPDVPQVVVGDAARTGQVLESYVENAVKYTDGPIAVHARMQGKRDGDEFMIYFGVTDRGAGLTPAEQSKLFQSFQQADASTTRLQGGTGMGLALAKQLAQLMGGDAGVHSAPGKGSTFWFTARFTEGDAARIPAAVTPVPAPAQASAPAAAVVDWARVKHVMEELDALLARDDADAVALFNEHAPLLRAALGEAAAGIERDLGRFMFPETLAALRRAAARLQATSGARA